MNVAFLLLTSCVAGADAPPAAPAAPAATEVPDTGTVALKGSMWTVDGHKGTLREQKAVRLEETALKTNHTITITNCEFVNVYVPTKVNKVTVNGCKRVSLMVADIIANIEVVGSQRLNITCTGAIQSITIDKSDSVNVTLSEHGLAADIITSVSSAVNITIPKGDDDVELALADQFITKIEGGKLVTRPYEHAA